MLTPLCVGVTLRFALNVFRQRVGDFTDNRPMVARREFPQFANQADLDGYKRVWGFSSHASLRLSFAINTMKKSRRNHFSFDG